MSLSTAHRLASSRPLPATDLRRYGMADLDALSLGPGEFRAQRAVLSKRLSEVGVKRYLQPSGGRAR